MVEFNRTKRIPHRLINCIYGIIIIATSMFSRRFAWIPVVICILIYSQHAVEYIKSHFSFGCVAKHPDLSEHRWSKPASKMSEYMLYATDISATNLPNVERFGKSDPLCVIEFQGRWFLLVCGSRNGWHISWLIYFSKWNRLETFDFRLVVLAYKYAKLFYTFVLSVWCFSCYLPSEFAVWTADCTFDFTAI